MHKNFGAEASPEIHLADQEGDGKTILRWSLVRQMGCEDQRKWLRIMSKCRPSGSAISVS
jgi:hypothetical protein